MGRQTGDSGGISHAQNKKNSLYKELVYSTNTKALFPKNTLLKPGPISLTRPDTPNDTVPIGPHVRGRSWPRPILMSPFRSPAAREPLRGCISASASLKSLSPRRASTGRSNGRRSLRSPIPCNLHSVASSNVR